MVRIVKVQGVMVVVLDFEEALLIHRPNLVILFFVITVEFKAREVLYAIAGCLFHFFGN